MKFVLYTIRGRDGFIWGTFDVMRSYINRDIEQHFVLTVKIILQPRPDRIIYNENRNKQHSRGKN